MNNVLYKRLLIYELSDNLKNIDCSSAGFFLNWKEYLQDEEYILDNKFIKCPYCDSEHIRRKYAKGRNFEEFIRDNQIYYNREKDYWDYFYLKHTLELMTIVAGYANIEFCDDCKKVITANEKPFFFYYHTFSGDYEKLYIDEGLMNKNKSPVLCPSCGSKNFFAEENYDKEIIQHIYCVRCKSYICDRDTSDNNYYLNMQYFGHKFS